MYRLDNRHLGWPAVVALIGCGGTGGFVADGLCRLLPRDWTPFLIDFDRVEERNLGRSSFTANDLGRVKSEALAQRLARLYSRPVQYSTLPVSMVELRAALVLGCVDNGLARLDIANNRGRYAWWIDAGNDHNYGQVLMGNALIEHLQESFAGEACRRLPLPTIQRPELLAQVPPRRDCNDAVATGEQGPTINLAMAALVLEVVRRLIDGTCPWMQIYLDLDQGTLSPVYATPEAVSKMTGIKVKKLIAKGGDK